MDSRNAETRGDTQVPSVAQSLFARRGPCGRTWEFARFTDGGCGLLCDGTVVLQGGVGAEAVDCLLGEFLFWSGTPATCIEPGGGSARPRGCEGDAPAPALRLVASAV